MDNSYFCLNNNLVDNFYTGLYIGIGFNIGKIFFNILKYNYIFIINNKYKTKDDYNNDTYYESESDNDNETNNDNENETNNETNNETII